MEGLPEPPEVLSFEPVTLRFAKTVPGRASLGLVPYFHYRVLVDGEDVGHINLRVGETEHVRFCVGHVGFAVEVPRRGHRYALHACRALAPLARAVCPKPIITCDPENHASRRTIELLGADFIDERPVPPHDPQYAQGSRSKRRYLWLP